MNFIRIEDANARNLARCADFFDLIDARNTPPALMLVQLQGEGRTVHPFFLRSGESDRQLWERVVDSAKLIYIAGDGQRVRITCLYPDLEVSR